MGHVDVEMQSVKKVLESLPPLPRVCILGGTSFNDPDSELVVHALASEMSASLSGRIVIITGGMKGVQELFVDCLGFFPETHLVHLVPVGVASGFCSGRDVKAGGSLEERMWITAQVGHVYISVEGGPGVAKEAKTAFERGAVVLPLISTGGASSGMFDFPAGAISRPYFATVEQWKCLQKKVEPESAARAIVDIIFKVLVRDKLVSATDRSSVNVSDVAVLRMGPEPDGKVSGRGGIGVGVGGRLSGARRTAVSAEAFGHWNRARHSSATKFPKSEEARMWLTQALGHDTLCGELDEEALGVIVDGCRARRISERSEVIIREGDLVAEDEPGMYILEYGEFKVYRSCPGIPFPGQAVNTYTQRGDIVGELALLYNAPRAATVIASQASMVWSVNRRTVNAARRASAERQRHMFDHILAKADVLSSLKPADRARVADSLRVVAFAEGDTIIRQGDIGDAFFLMLSGEATAMRSRDVVKRYRVGGHFGELALLYDQPRKATVVADTRVVCAALDRNSFNRLVDKDLFLQHAESAYLRASPGRRPTAFPCRMLGAAESEDDNGARKSNRARQGCELRLPSNKPIVTTQVDSDLTFIQRQGPAWRYHPPHRAVPMISEDDSSRSPSPEPLLPQARPRLSYARNAHEYSAARRCE